MTPIQKEIDEILETFGYEVVDNPDKTRVELIREAKQSLATELVRMVEEAIPKGIPGYPEHRLVREIRTRLTAIIERELK